MKTELKKMFKVDNHSVTRLLVTESARINSIAKQTSFTKAGFDKFKNISVIDDRTSRKCTSMNNKIFLLNNLTVGENAPPFHPFCRSTITPTI